MKKVVTLFVFVIIVAACGLFLSYQSETTLAHGSSSGSPAARTGSPGDGGQTCKTCHSGPAALSLPGLITSNIPTSGYVPGTTYQLTASISGAGHTKFGFQVSPQNATGTLLGTLVNTSSQTQLVGTGKYVTHNNSGNQGAGSKSWSFDWIAPAAGTGAVTFYGAFNVTNANNQSSGDSVYTSTLTVNESTVGINDVYSLAENVNVYPTVATEFFTYQISVKTEEIVTAQLIDASGKIVKTIFENESMTGNIKKNIDVATLPSGFYFIHTLANNQKDVRKIIVTK